MWKQQGTTFHISFQASKKQARPPRKSKSWLPGSSSGDAWWGQAHRLRQQSVLWVFHEKTWSVFTLVTLGPQQSAWSAASCEGAAVLNHLKHYASLPLYFVFGAQTTSCSPKIHHYLLPYEKNSDFCWRWLHVHLQKLHFSGIFRDSRGQWHHLANEMWAKSCWTAEKAL